MKTKASVLTLGGALAAGFFLTTGCVEHRVVYVHDAPGTPVGSPETVVSEAPPAGEAPPSPQVEVVGVAPGPEYIWVGGSWTWRGRWVWGPGRWVIRPHPHAVWVGGHWNHHRHGWIWARGYWR